MLVSGCANDSSVTNQSPLLVVPVVQCPFSPDCVAMSSPPVLKKQLSEHQSQAEKKKTKKKKAKTQIKESEQIEEGLASQPSQPAAAACDSQEILDSQVMAFGDVKAVPESQDADMDQCEVDLNAPAAQPDAEVNNGAEAPQAEGEAPVTHGRSTYTVVDSEGRVVSSSQADFMRALQNVVFMHVLAAQNDVEENNLNRRQRRGRRQ